MIDTNMYDYNDKGLSKTCKKDSYYEDKHRQEQRAFINRECEDAKKRGDWVIVMGHIPAVANGHKETKPVIFNRELLDILKECSPHLYMCGDEHNQQFIAGFARSERSDIAGFARSEQSDIDEKEEKSLLKDELIGVKTAFAIVGSGGTQLDPLYTKDVYGTKYAKSVFGFSTVKPEENRLKLTFHNIYDESDESQTFFIYK